MPTPEVSVVVPTRNRLPLLAQTLHSVLEQDVDLEVLVIDEASTDATPTWIADHPDRRIRTIRHETPRGLAEARNAGIAAARGRWLAFTDDDDLWLPDKLDRQLVAAREQDARWAFAGAITFTEEPRLLEISRPLPDAMDRLPWINMVPGGGSNAIIARQLLEASGGFDPDLSIVADWDMWLRLLQHDAPAIVPEPLMAYRIHTGAMSRDLEQMLDGLRAIEDRYRHMRDDLTLDWSETYGWLERRAWRTGDRRAARRVAVASLADRRGEAVVAWLRTLMPLAKRVPVSDPAHAQRARDRISKREVLRWPDGIEPWLRGVLEVTP